MGYGSYDISKRSVRYMSSNFDQKSAREIFSSYMNESMSPRNVGIRESRDSEEHPNSLPIIIALDVTGSMLGIPEHFVREGLPNLMKILTSAGIKDPQIMFLAIGDHVCDQAPIQVSQFESDDEHLDQWLTRVWLEGKGGGNGGESYCLAHYFAAKHTVLDSFEKRGQKGFLFTIGDEPFLTDYPASVLRQIFGDDGLEKEVYDASELVQMSQESYNVHHMHMLGGSNGSNKRILPVWEKLLGENVHEVKFEAELIQEIANCIISNFRQFAPTIETPVSSEIQVNPGSSTEEIIL